MKPITTLLSITRLLSVGSCLLLGSCSQGEDALTSGAPGNALLPISVEASLADVVATRTTGYTPVPSGGAIGVFRTAPVTADSPAQRDVKYTYNGTQWSPESEAKQIVVGAENATLCAYYPQGKVSFTVNTTQTALTVKDYSAANDLCYADKPVQAAVNNANRAVSFLMEHAYSRLQIHITRSSTADYPNACKITSIQMEPATAGSEFYTARTINVGLPATNGSQLTGSKAASWTLNTAALAMGATGISKGATDTGIDKLFPPQAFSTNVGTKLTLTIDGKNRTVTVPYAKLTGLKAGEISRIMLEIQGTELVVESVQIKQWSNVPSGTHDSTLD